MRDAHALATATSRRLDHHRITDFVGDLHGMLVVLDDPEMTRHGRNLGLGRGLFGFDLVAHRGNRARIGTDEHDARRFERARKCLTLRQEAVTRMHSLRAGPAAGLDDLLHDEIALSRLRRSDKHSFVGHFDVERVAVGLRIDGNRLDAHPACGLDDPASDFAAIGDQYLFEHGAI